MTAQLTTFRRHETTGCGGDDAEEDDEIENEDDSEDGEGRTASGVQPKRRQERSFYFKTVAVKRIHSREGTSSVCLRWACRVQQDHRFAQRRNSGCATSLLDVRHSPQREDYHSIREPSTFRGKCFSIWQDNRAYINAFS